MNLVGLAIFLAFLYAGFLWLTAAGRPASIAKAKEIMTNAIAGAIILLASYLILHTINPDLVKQTFKLPGIGTEPTAIVSPGNGGSGTCRNPGNTTAYYTGNLSTAINAVIAENPEGIADKLNSTENSFSFLNFVAGKLQSAGFKATTNVKNGNDNPNTGDLIALWREGDSTIERYDAIADAGAVPGTSESGPLRTKITTDFTGDIPLSCLK